MKLVTTLTIAAALTLAGAAAAMQFSAWGSAQKLDEIGGNSSELNTASLDGCPIQSPDGRSLFIASNRPGGKGGLDIWVATRESSSAPWGTPQNLPEPINSASDDFCPTPVRGRRSLLREPQGACRASLADSAISISPASTSTTAGASRSTSTAHPTARTPRSTSKARAWSRSTGAQYLYFSSSRAAAQGDRPRRDLRQRGDPRRVRPRRRSRRSQRRRRERHPAEHPQGRTRARLQLRPRRRRRRAGHLGLHPRRHRADAWSAPVNLGPAVNTAASESRPSLSWHAEQLLFGRAPGPEGNSDIYVSTR